jgi:hypothetical protein
MLQFGLHDIAYDDERLSVELYTALLTNITNYLVSVQKSHGSKLVWVTTTPVPTVPTYGNDCNSTTGFCMNPPRFNDDGTLLPPPPRPPTSHNRSFTLHLTFFACFNRVLRLLFVDLFCVCC